MNANNERGIALIITLILMSALTVLAASMMFLSQTETYASMNYRMMSQARYAAEAGVQRASNFLMDGSQYTVPGGAGDPLTNYVRTGSPVTYGGNPVVLSTTGGSNYPIAGVVTAFTNAAKGSLTASNATLNYNTTAKLISMQQFESYGGTQNVVQTWEITAVGSLTSSRNATVEVTALIETPKVPANSYAAFATADTCGAMYFHGNVTVDSYDSRLGSYDTTKSNTGGNVGTNGNLKIQGSVDVKGTLSTPRTGVGTCEEGAVTALSEIGSAQVKACATCSTADSIIKLPKAVLYPPPVFSVTPPTTTVTIDNGLLNSPTACQDLGTILTGGVPMPLVMGPNCIVDKPNKTIRIDGNGNDITLANVSIASGFKLVIDGNSGPPQSINVNSLSGSGEIDVNANLTGALNESVVIKVAGKTAAGADMAAPFNLADMGWKQNSSTATKYDASALQIVYGGMGQIAMDGGNAQTAVTVYAPNASFLFKGTQDLFGSVLAKTIENEGNASFHYDRRLSGEFWVAGAPMAGTFSWKRY